jgi:hypothetical protein
VSQSAEADSLAPGEALILLEQDFESALAAIPSDWAKACTRVCGRRQRAQVPHGKRTSLFARALAGDDVVSLNLC